MPLDQETNTLYDLDLQFPPLSRTVAEVSSILASSEAPDTEKLIEVVNQDPLVVATVLKRINSAYYGMRRKFGDLRKAVVMIGFIEVSNIILTSSYISLRKIGSSKKEMLAVGRIIRASIGAGYLTNLLAQEFDLAQKPIAFTSGLLHNIGRFVLLYNHQEAYTNLIEESEGYLPTVDEERRTLGIDHAAIGAIATQHWNFPDLIPRLIESYNTPGHLNNSKERELGIIMKASADIAHQLALAIQDFPDWNAEDGENEEPNKVDEDNSIFPLDWNLPQPLNTLLHTNGHNKQSLKEVLSSEQKPMLEYIEHMVKF